MDITSYLLGKKASGGGGGGKSKYTGHYDAQGLSQIGYTPEEIQFYQENGVDWNEEDDNYYKLTASELAGDDTKDTRFLPKSSTTKNFRNYNNLLTIPHITSTERLNTFASCYQIRAIDLSGFVSSNSNTMSGMFTNCYHLMSLDLSDFITTGVTNMSQTFMNCKSLTSLDLSDFNTSSVTNFNSLFAECNKLENLDVSSFDTSKGTNFGTMFQNCYSLRKLNLSNFNTSSATSMYGMFNQCYLLEEVDLRNMTTPSGCDCRQMFNTCYSLRKLDVRKATFSTLSSNNLTYFISGVPKTCLIIVKDTTEKNWFNTNYSTYTNVKTVEEYEAM